MDGWRRLALVAAIAAAVAACGETSEGGGGGGGGGPEASLPDSAEVTSDDERVPHPLDAGSYRLSWRATDCEAVHLRITAADGTVIYENPSPLRVTFVNDLAGGEYYIEQTEPSCTEWSISLVKV